MSKFFNDYRVAYNHAVMEARKGNRPMQLQAGREYAKEGFHVRLAIQNPAQRFGYEAQGEFIQPTAPLTVTHVAEAGYGYNHSGQSFGRLKEDTLVVVVDNEHANADSVIAYRVSDGLRMHIQKKALKVVDSSVHNE